MKNAHAVAALAALAQDSRLALYRLLVRRGPEGYAAGEIAARLRIPAPTLSFHLKALTQASLVTVRKESRFIYYSANFEHMSRLMAFLNDHCCSLASAGASPACAAPRASITVVNKRQAA